MGKKAILDPKFDEAINWLKEKNGTQIRVFSSSPYWIHPIQVAILVMKFKKSHKIDELVLAALFHDLVEDGHVTLLEVKERWGDLVASLVDELTSDPKGIKTWGKAVYLGTKVLQLSDWGLVIKLADRLANVSDFMFAPQEFIEKYATETKYILQQLSVRKLTATQQQVIKTIVAQLNLYEGRA